MSYPLEMYTKDSFNMWFINRRQSSSLQKQCEEEFPFVFRRYYQLFFYTMILSSKNEKLHLMFFTLMRLKFGNCGSLEQHGFARNKVWAIDDNPQLHPPNDSHGKSFIDLLLKPSEDDLKCWPHRYEL